MAGVPSLTHYNSRRYLFVGDKRLALRSVEVKLSQFACEHGLQQSVYATATFVWCY